MTVLIEPDLGRVSGGLRYNRFVADAAHGAITRHALPGTWPDPSARDDAALRHLAARWLSEHDVSAAEVRIDVVAVLRRRGASALVEHLRAVG